MSRWSGKFASVMVAATCVVNGCQQEEPLAIRPPQRATLDAPPATTDTTPTGETKLSDLAAQSQRDVDLILKSRAGQSGHTDTPPTASGTVSSEPRTPKTIVWNERTTAPGAVRAPASNDPSATAAVQTTSLSAGAINPTTQPAGEPSAASAASLGAERLRTLVADLSRELYASGSYSTTPLRELLTIAAMSMIDPQRTLDPKAIPDLTDKERELLGHLQMFFAELGRSLDSSGHDTEEAIVEAVAKLRETLVNPPALALPTAALCTRVNGFGDYTTFEKYTFLAQSQQKAIVYLEIGEFTSVMNDKGEYVTKLAQQLTIYADRDGIPVWKEDWQTAVDTTRNQRQDFFTVQVITLPKALTVGKYQLKVRVRDEQSQAEAETSIPFELVADPRLVGN